MDKIVRYGLTLLILGLSASTFAFDGAEPLPEPGTLALLASGIAAAAFGRKRGRK